MKLDTISSTKQRGLSVCFKRLYYLLDDMTVLWYSRFTNSRASSVFVTGPPNEPVLFCSLVSVGLPASSVVVCNAAGVRAGRSPGAWAVVWPTLHGGPVRLRPVRMASCLTSHLFRRATVWPAVYTACRCHDKHVSYWFK